MFVEAFDVAYSRKANIAVTSMRGTIGKKGLPEPNPVASLSTGGWIPHFGGDSPTFLTNPECDEKMGHDVDMCALRELPVDQFRIVIKGVACQLINAVNAAVQSDSSLRMDFLSFGSTLTTSLNVNSRYREPRIVKPITLWSDPRPTSSLLQETSSVPDNHDKSGVVPLATLLPLLVVKSGSFRKAISGSFIALASAFPLLDCN
ncbi:hypothetical protein V5799_030282 [Amblyomma americanum]|uniref:Uncharacterized protein n=1 Tax=Amblyomma americanum TaxID=6943 RepID=A0AAQ4ENL1_AMBAM